MVMINKFRINLHYCPKLQKKDRKLAKNKRKKVPLAERNEFDEIWKINFISQHRNRNYF